MITRLVMMLCLLAIGTRASAQEPYNLSAPVTNLATLFHDLFGVHGLIVDSEATLPGEQPHTAHFNSDFQFNFSKFQIALVSQLVTVPLPSPASGFTYEFDPTTGVFRRTTQGFGPILAERAETIGNHRVSFGFATQRFTFDTAEGLDLSSVPAVFTHDNAQLLGGRQDVVTTTNSIRSSVNQFVTYVTVGITDHLDVSMAFPVVATHMTAVSEATIQRLGTTNELTHFYRQSDGSIGNERVFTATGDASGIGDVVVRVKTSVLTKPSTGVAAGVDVRVPSGDALNLLGTGAPGVQPFAVLSGTIQRVSPHINVGYQWNGSSLLAGDPATGRASDFPDQFNYVVGADLNAGRLTVALDVLGRYLFDAERLGFEEFHALDGKSVFPNVTFSTQSFNLLNGSLGAKINAIGRVLLDVNVLFALDNHGVRDKVTPLLGFEYSF